MSEYYYSDSDKADQKPRSVVGLIVDCVTLVISFVALVALVVALITPYCNPSSHWIFPFVGIIAPIIYLVASVMALYWVIRWKIIYAAILIVPLLIGAPRVSRYFRIEPSKHYPPLSMRGIHKIMTYNVKGFINDDKQVSIDDVMAFVESEKPDIICFQEFDAKRYKEEEHKYMKRYHTAKAGALRVFSRFDIINSSELFFDEHYKSGSAMWADLAVGHDTLRLYNLHLHSTAIKPEDNIYLSTFGFVGDSLSDERIRSIISRLDSTSVWRVEQVDSLVQNIEESKPRDIMICGDFNDTPNTYVYHNLSRGLQDSFQECGDGYAHTYKGFMDLLRIDYTFLPQSIEPLSYRVGYEADYSDHYPVITTFKYR